MGKTFGFIGAGNMGGALARATAKTVDPAQIFLADQLAGKASDLAQQMGAQAVPAQQIAKDCDFIFLGVKPQVMETMLGQIAQELSGRTDSFVLVSMAAGIPMAEIRRMAGGQYPVIRIMPNIPASVGSGVILFDKTENVTDAQAEAFCAALSGAGLVDPLPEKLIDAGSALSGCGPAFVSLFVEALADGAVACGLPRDKAILYAEQTVAGTAEMLLQTGTAPATLKDAVCSPGGTTIMGVNALEQGGFRAATMDAVIRAYRRTQELGK